MNLWVVETDREFDALEEPWNRLSEKAAPNFFSSFDYVRTVWKHFRGPNDRLYILVLSEGPSVVGIAPFYIAQFRTWRIPHRTIQWIAVWEGDRPRLLVEGNEETCWNEIFQFLKNQEHSWEVLDLVEQRVDGPEGRGWLFLRRYGWHCEERRDAIDYYISLEGSWDDYLKGLGSETRNQWRRKARRLSSAPGGYTVERISEQSQMRKALDRFVRLERSGWKAGAGVGAGKDKQHIAFYEDLLVRLAGKGQVTAHFLTSNKGDIAGWICFIQQDVVYFRHTAYLPTYASYSPGILIQAEVIQQLFEGGMYRELDLLGMREDGTPPRHKTEWATGRRETVRLTAYRPCSRLLPLIVAKRLKRILKGGSGDLESSKNT